MMLAVYCCYESVHFTNFPAQKLHVARKMSLGYRNAQRQQLLSQTCHKSLSTLPTKPHSPNILKVILVPLIDLREYDVRMARSF